MNDNQSDMPHSAQQACADNATTRIELKKNNIPGNKEEERGQLTRYRLILSAPPGGLQRGIPDVTEMLAKKLKEHTPSQVASELSGSEGGVQWQLLERPGGSYRFRNKDCLGLVRAIDWFNAFRDFRPNQDRDWIAVLIQTDSLVPNRGASFFVERIKYRMMSNPRFHRLMVHEECGMCYCAYPAIPQEGEGHTPLRQITLACSVPAGKFQAAIPDFLRNFVARLWRTEKVSTEGTYGGPRLLPETLPEQAEKFKFLEGLLRSEDALGRGGEPVLWSVDSCVMTFTSPFFLAETQAGCVEPVAWDWHERRSGNSDSAHDRLWAVLEADAFVGYEELAERFIQMAAALEQGIMEKAEKHTTGGWAFRAFPAR